jgi:hypothetical protein
MTDEQINALDAKILSGFDTVLTTATADREAAELAKRAQEQLYSDQIAPALDGWANEKAQKDAEIAFYRAQAEAAKAGGFVPKDAPGYKPPQQDPGTGRFVPGANPVPGSPAYLTAQDGIKAVSNVTWVMSEHQRLFNQPLPDDFETLMNESVAQRMNFRDYVDKKYGFAAKRQEIATAKQKEHDDKIAKDTETRIRKEYAEAGGNNPNVRTGLPSQFDKVKAATAAGTRKDPLTMGAEERRAQTRANIHTELNDNAAATIN